MRLHHCVTEIRDTFSTLLIYRKAKGGESFPQVTAYEAASSPTLRLLLRRREEGGTPVRARLVHTSRNRFLGDAMFMMVAVSRRNKASLDSQPPRCPWRRRITGDLDFLLVLRAHGICSSMRGQRGGGGEHVGDLLSSNLSSVAMPLGVGRRMLLLRFVASTIFVEGKQIQV